MKSTYLVFDNMGQLRVAAKEEWNEIMERNRTLPREQRRFFIQDCIEDCGILDCMYIETTKAEYDKWHSAHQVQYKKRKDTEGIVTLSGDISTQTEDGTLLDTLSDDINWEDLMIDGIRMKELRQALSTWEQWGVELLDMYLNGQKVRASQFLSQKYGFTLITARRRRQAFEKFVLNFLK